MDKYYTLKEKCNWYKYLLFIVILLVINYFYISNLQKDVIKELVEVEVVNTIIIPDSSLVLTKDLEDDLVNALIYIESRGNDDAVNNSSGATGCLQLLPIMVREVNNILTRVGSGMRYKLDDRLNRKSSIEMFNIWRYYHHGSSSYEVIARNWNGGPRGYLKESTISYWNNVKKRL